MLALKRELDGREIRTGSGIRTLTMYVVILRQHGVGTFPISIAVE